MSVNRIATRRVSVGALAGFACFVMLAGCSEETALEPASVPAPRAEAQPAPPPQPGGGQGFTGSQSHLGKARDAAERVIDRAEQQQQDMVDQIDQWQRDPASNDPIPPSQPR